MTKSIAHRGDWTLHPENTMESFIDAGKNGADMIELDVKVTKDGHAVVLHDHTLNLIWGDPRKIIDMTLDEIQNIKLGSYYIPLFEEVINNIDVPFMVDFDEPKAVESMVEVLKKQKSLERFLVVTGDIESLAKVKELIPQVEIGLTWISPLLPDDNLIRKLKIKYFNPNHLLLNNNVIEHMRQRGLNISCWTVDDASHMKSMIDLNVDYIVTNKLSSLLSILK